MRVLRWFETLDEWGWVAVLCGAVLVFVVIIIVTQT